MKKPGSVRDPLWYKDAIIYELHVKAFFDGNGDGIGDFAGLTQKLDYLQDLGVTAIWLLPFYPVAAARRRLRHCRLRERPPDLRHAATTSRRFIREAHERGMRVITELVINHTSDQHPWFQRARQAPSRAAERDFYVWSDTDQKYRDARIIFQDIETLELDLGSRWPRPTTGTGSTRHQPDLNFDNPAVQEAMFRRSCDFWLDMGVDGLRLDAVPYLFEREGTNCENLPETHAVPQADPRRTSTTSTRAGCCWPRRTSGRRTRAPTSATATNATWPSTSR